MSKGIDDAKPTSLTTALAVCIAVFSALTGFLAGTAAFSGRLAVVETEYRQVSQVQSDVHQLREDVARIAAIVGTKAIAQTSLTHTFRVPAWDYGLTQRYRNSAKRSGN